MASHTLRLAKHPARVSEQRVEAGMRVACSARQLGKETVAHARAAYSSSALCPVTCGNDRRGPSDSPGLTAFRACTTHTEASDS